MEDLVAKPMSSFEGLEQIKNRTTQSRQNSIAPQWKGFENWKLRSGLNDISIISIQNIEKVLFRLQL